jgi:hypothetical protein
MHTGYMYAEHQCTWQEPSHRDLLSERGEHVGRRIQWRTMTKELSPSVHLPERALADMFQHHSTTILAHWCPHAEAPTQLHPGSPTS